MTLALTLYLLGWTIQLLLEAQNSIQSPSNGLAPGVPGLKRWLELQALNALGRLFLSVMLFPAILDATEKLFASSGVAVAKWGLAGIAGYSASALLKQLSGLIPSLRVEIPKLAPPSPSSSPVDEAPR